MEDRKNNGKHGNGTVQGILSYKEAEGEIPYNMTNDYMFHAVLETNQKVLTGLICSLLHLAPADVKSVDVRNRVMTGKGAEEKEFVLDMRVLLNNHKHINLEMQVVNLYNWPERSLSYACRDFDNISRGNDYLDVEPVIHIGFLDFTLFPEAPEFYAEYRMQNVKNHREYSDKLSIRVLELNQTGIATDEDRAYQLDRWAAAFKAKTWKEMSELAAENIYIAEAAQTMYDLNEDERVREDCRRREDERNYRKAIEKRLSAKDAQIASQSKEIASQSKEIASLNQEIDVLKKEMERLRSLHGIED